jgi:DNA-binding transcriptional LysR family regulator
MDLDLAQVRAFVAVVDEAHFGRAAEALSVSQQAVSKRVARLEAELGARLLTRGANGVTLTAAGRRFLEPARRALAAGDLAAAAARHEERPLRVDVWGHLFAPMRTVQQALQYAPDLHVELGPGRDLPAVIGALARGEIDAGLGRVYPAGGLDDRLAHRLVRLEPVDAILGAGHVLANRDELNQADLRGSTLLFPAAASRLDFLTRFADQFGISDRAEGANLGFGHFIDRVRADPRCFSLLPADISLPGGTTVQTIPIVDPSPLYAWSLVWRRDDQHPRLSSLLQAFADAGRHSRWLEYRPSADWLPDPDRTEAREHAKYPRRTGPVSVLQGGNPGGDLGT